jgi:hypothetical protein
MDVTKIWQELDEGERSRKRPGNARHVPSNVRRLPSAAQRRRKARSHWNANGSAKTPYISQEAATKRARTIMEAGRGDRMLSVYKCDYCMLWHLGGAKLDEFLDYLDELTQ